MLSVVFKLVYDLFAVVTRVVIKFPNFRVSLTLGTTLRVATIGFFLCLTILPVVTLAYQETNDFLINMVVTFICKCKKVFTTKGVALTGLCPVATDLKVMNCHDCSATIG